MLLGVYYLFLFLCEVFSHSTHQPKLGVHQINQGEWPAEIYRGITHPFIRIVISWHEIIISWHDTIISCCVWIDA